MSTNSSSAATLSPLLLNWNQLAKFSVAFNYAIIPCLSAVGICGNVLSMLLLARRGFRKASNVLLLALAVADVLYLVGVNNVSFRVLDANIPARYRFSESDNNILYVFCGLQLAVLYAGAYYSMLIPVLITGERLIVIFLPLKAHSIVTPLRILVVILCFSLVVITCFVYIEVLCSRFEQVVVEGGFMGRVVPSELLKRDLDSGAYLLFLYCQNYVTDIIPMIIVILGSSVIGLKVTMITRRRLKITSGGVTSKSKPSSRKVVSRTSKTLIKICVLFIVCRSFGFIVLYVIRISALEYELPLIAMFDIFNTLFLCINNVGNFIIYVASNNNFKYKDLRICRLLRK